MADNDVLLLDSLAQKNYAKYGEDLTLGEQFELFVFDCVLRNYDLSYEELEDGWVDGPDDGGIDGFYVFIDGIPLTDDFESKNIRREAQLSVIIITAKIAETFKQAPMNSLIDTLQELFDLSLDTFENVYNKQIIDIRRRFKSAYIDLADRNPNLSFKVLSCSRGSIKRAAPNVKAKTLRIKKLLTDLFSRSTVDSNLLGAAEILQLAQKTRRYSLRLPFSDNYISREGENYVILCQLDRYLDFITDEDGNLRRYLFEGNVRDYLGDVQVNANIAASLQEQSNVDFWWLNNGVTMLVSSATIVAKSLQLENVLIVNGLQTTETIYRTLHSKGAVDSRAILVKIINNADDETRTRIIKATNYQNSVDLASLRSLDRIQINIEQYLLDYGWFYERRHNFYRNQGKPSDRIISIKQLGAAVRAITFRTPRTAERRQKWLRDDNSYFAVFNENYPIDLFLICTNIVRSVEKTLKSKEHNAGIYHLPSQIFRQWAYFVACLLVMKALKNENMILSCLLHLKAT